MIWHEAGTFNLDTQIGNGYDSVKQEEKANSVLSDLSPPYDEQVDPDRIGHYQLCVSQQSVMSFLGANARIRAGYLGEVAEIAAEYLKKFAITETSVVLAAEWDVRTKYYTIDDVAHMEWSVEAKTTLEETPERFLDLYGDRLCDQVRLGGKMFLFFRTDFRTVSEKEKFVGDVIVGGGNIGVGTGLEQNLVRLNNAGHIDVQQKIKGGAIPGVRESVQDWLNYIADYPNTVETTPAIEAIGTLKLSELSSAPHPAIEKIDDLVNGTSEVVGLFRHAENWQRVATEYNDLGNRVRKIRTSPGTYNVSQEDRSKLDTIGDEINDAIRETSNLWGRTDTHEINWPPPSLAGRLPDYFNARIEPIETRSLGPVLSGATIVLRNRSWSTYGHPGCVTLTAGHDSLVSPYSDANILIKAKNGAAHAPIITGSEVFLIYQQKAAYDSNNWAYYMPSGSDYKIRPWNYGKGNPDKQGTWVVELEGDDKNLHYGASRFKLKNKYYSDYYMGFTVAGDIHRLYSVKADEKNPTRFWAVERRRREFPL